jgi:Helicase conserved C-terminal domain
MEAATRPGAPVTAVEVRERLVEALDLDLVGPWPGHELAAELLPGWVRPSNWYLTGFLVPADAPEEQRVALDADDDLDEVPETAGLAEESAEDRGAARKGFFPSSLGLSTLVAAEARSLSVTVRWGDYEPGDHLPERAAEGKEGEDGDEGAGEGPDSERVGRERDGVTAGGEGAGGGSGDGGGADGGEDGESGEAGDGKPTPVWRRVPRERLLDVPLAGAEGPRTIHVPDSGGLELYVLERPVAAAGLDGRIPPGTRSVSLFLLNARRALRDEPDRAYAFQAALEVGCAHPFVPRPDLRGALAEEWDECVADLHYADTPEYAAGHGVSADWELVGGECRVLSTRWIPSAEVEKTATSAIEGVELRMEVLGALADGAAAHAALAPLVERYRAWIETRRGEARVLEGTRRETAEELLRLAELAAERIARGIAVLGEDAAALEAFKAANRAVSAALCRRLGVDAVRWHPFQLAFILLNLPGLADPADPHRETVDLLYFPTGGGKTEAYLGLSAFALVLRRLRHPGDGGRAGAGVSIVMRYTLRLLTLDQLARAAGLVCALELERQADPVRYGEWPFEIGLWVGKAATPNVMGHKGDGRSDTARAKVHQFKREPRTRPSPIPLEACPWCGTRFEPDSFALLPDDDHPRELRIVCMGQDCEFTRDRALPIVAVDEPLYRRLPAFLVATVDKFAALPWVGPSGALLGGADRHDAEGFYGAAEPRQGTPLQAPLPPPDLVIQDELHLISGPLGTMAGLYETAIDGLCVRALDGRAVRPKIVASTATVRRAEDQIQALFARSLTQIFPPPGPDRRDSFFAATVPAAQAPARRYVGIAAQGRNPKVVMRRVWLALMGAAECAYRDAGGHRNHANPADPYMTVLGYFNSLRELGGARRILEEEVRNTARSYGARRRIGERRGLFRDRATFSEVVELTSRVSTDRVADARRRLGAPFHEKDRVDCAIATNMISVGLDIPRLGLMGVLGQPKTAAEYIQATSRVGRSDAAPGLVVTLLNVHKPRDRSHYERFRHFHATFYRSVEVGSVTPFSARALDRGFAGALVALARHLAPQLTQARGAERLAAVRTELEPQLLELFRLRVLCQPLEEDERAERLSSVQSRLVDLLDSWSRVYEDYAAHGVALQYQCYELAQPKPLLREMLDTDFDSAHHRKFRVNRSLRDVEPSVNLALKELSGS